MIQCPNIEKTVIRNHYDVTTPFYRLFWGPHIHHGYWDADESSTIAQEKLTAQLAKRAEIRPGSMIYDIGCGMGGSSRWLAKNLACNVTGVTLSPIQRWWASTTSRMTRSHPTPNFLCADAERIEFPKASADYVWSIECTEHLFDKPAFFRRSAGWLKTGGKFALCAWLAGNAPLSAEKQEQAQTVCKGMFCPSLGSQQDYLDWFQQAGMKVTLSEIWTDRVKQTWEICKKRVDRSGVRHLARILGQNHLLFLNHFDAILNAYNSGAMEYGVFVAEKCNEANSTPAALSS